MGLLFLLLEFWSTPAREGPGMHHYGTDACLIAFEQGVWARLALDVADNASNLPASTVLPGSYVAKWFLEALEGFQSVNV